MYEFGTKNERRGELRAVVSDTLLSPLLRARPDHTEQLEPDTASKLGGLFDDAVMPACTMNATFTPWDKKPLALKS